jgi:anti-sigma factor RsiW
MHYRLPAYTTPFLKRRGSAAMGSHDDQHPDDESLESYLLSSLDQHKAKQIEEHLLVCQLCRQNVIELKEYIQAMRKALKAEA